MNQYILVHTSIYSDFLHTNAFISRYSIHHGTGQYNEVPKSPVYLDYDGTRRYIKVQGFVLLSTPFKGGTPDFGKWGVPP